MSDDIVDSPSNEVLQSELRAVRRELASGFQRLEAALDRAHDDTSALEARVRVLETLAAANEGGERKARDLLVLASGAAALLGSALTALVQWLIGGGGSKP